MDTHDIVIIGGGQMGLSLGYYLHRAKADFLILDAEDGPGGAWRHGWESLRLFSPAGYSSLPGWLMPPPNHDGYPTRDDVLDYLSRYEERYHLPVRRPARVTRVHRSSDHLEIDIGSERLAARHVVSATGTWSHPHVPDMPGRDLFQGTQVHSAHYVRPEHFAGRTVLVVGGGNSGAQIMAEVAPIARALWVTNQDPLFLSDDVDGRVLFERAVARMKAGPGETPVGGIGDIVMVPPVREARGRGDLTTVRPFLRMTSTGVVWPDRSEMKVDAIIWCTGFRPALDHLRSLDIVEADGRVLVEDQRSVEEPRLWLAGYGDWTGPGSATLMGAARTARDLVRALISEATS
ncbi:ArsO family NAD(P)H-dependent flavin-containing monooxygenase [Novosphingobium sp. CECT 9465]|uniref:ArsO family NAD(P)H-dependent flavin-containing monooxygenase n=1 Tax=Novosphingobium sp. CECT 9465 TaxID=2829794 RepID=UPI001E3748E9|nr:ArsO family NAD(P)H-dependent flavin-containing monooxygenase [Novosphingobium sp. CECT 9465]